MDLKARGGCGLLNAVRQRAESIAIWCVVLSKWHLYCCCFGRKPSAPLVVPLCWTPSLPCSDAAIFDFAFHATTLVSSAGDISYIEAL